jgi:hypothetical protein
MRTLLKWSLRLLALFVLAFAGLLAFSTLTDYQPEPESEEQLVLNGKATKIEDDTFTALIWNIGYAGLGAEVDFFNDGGKMVRPNKP